MMKMMNATNPTKWLVLIGLTLAVAMSSLACQEESGLEKAGAAVDETIDDVTHPNEGPLEKAGRKVSETVEDVAK